MSLGDDLRLFRDKVHRRSRDVFVGSVNAVHGSVVDGSTVTAAPGQPVDTGNLKASWIESFPGEWVGETATNVVYAPAIEEGQQAPYTTSPSERVIEETGQIISVAGGAQVTPGPMTLQSKVGGFHSVKLTRAGWNKLMESVVKEVVG